MVSFLTYGLLATTATTSLLVSAAPASEDRKPQGLNDMARANGKVYFGTAADIPGTGELQDKYYMQIFNDKKTFGGATPANAMKWVNTEPSRGVFNFTQADEFVKVAKKSNKVIRCHNIVWHNQAPDWVNNGNWTKSALLEVIEERAREVISHFGDDCYAWDVVNEALNDDGTYRESIFYNVTGTDYIVTAFRAAQRTVRERGLRTKLYYNDYNIENPGAKSTAAAGIVRLLQENQVQIDGVGLQSHFVVGSTPSQADQVANMKSFTGLGVDVAITELDIRTATPPTDAAKAQQGVDFNTTVGACAKVERCVGTTLWDFVDTYSWIPGVFTGEGYGTPWYQPGGANTTVVKKQQAYDGIVAGLTTK